MAARETNDLRNLDDGALARELESSHQGLFNLRFQSSTRQLADVSQVHKARRRLARVKTLLGERAILAEHDRLEAQSLEAQGSAGVEVAEGD